MYLRESGYPVEFGGISGFFEYVVRRKVSNSLNFTTNPLYLNEYLRYGNGLTKRK